MLDAIVAYIDPRRGYEREAYRQGLTALIGQRSYAAGDRGRLNRDWRGDTRSPDAAIMNDLGLMRGRQRRMVRSNPLLASVKRNLIVGLIGDGITVRVIHEDPVVRERAQRRWDEFCARILDDRDDFYGVQRQAVSGMIDADCLLIWRPQNGKPDQRVSVLPGDYLDHTLNQALPGGGKIVMGVEFDADGQRVAYHIFDDHPGDLVMRNAGKRRRVDARDVDHVYERLEPGMTRGVPWMHASLATEQERDETKRAIRIKKRVQACLALFRRPGDGGEAFALGKREKQENGAAGPLLENMRPGMIIYGQPGEEAPTAITPSSDGDGDGFLRGEAMQVCAGIGVPYHLGTGDYSQSNFTSMRSENISYHARLDDWTFHQIEPACIGPAFRRVMRLGVLEGDSDLVNVRYEVLPPPRALTDPLKEVMAKVIEVRAIPGGLARWLSSQGLDLETAMKAQAEINSLIDKHRIALDTDPRRVNGSGSLQPAAGYLAPKGGEDELRAVITRLFPQLAAD